MNRIDTDVAVIGAGTAGLAAYRVAQAAGKRAVLVEGGAHGTTCARVGCMPSKLLIAAAEAAHAVERLGAFGIELEGGIRVDGRAVMARVKRERDRFVGFVLDGVDRIPAADRITGRARFIDDHTLQVDEHTTIAFTSAVIATGSSPSIPPILRAAGDRLVVNDDIFDWDELPRRVAVFGPGVIGLELGQALARLGVEVRMFGRGGPVGPFGSPELRRYAEQAFNDEFYLDSDARVERVERTPEGVAVHYTDREGRPAVFTADQVVAATGRAPNVDRIGLEHTSLARDARGVPTFDRGTLQCGTSHIFIAGDANNDVPLLHEAADEGRIAGENAARWPLVEPGLRRAPIGVVFTDPQIAVIGHRLDELVPGTFVVGQVSFEDQGRSRVMLRNRGLLHIYANSATGRLVGAEMFGPDAEHIAHLLAWSLQAGFTVEQMLQMPFYHPVVEEGLRTALRDAQAKLGERGQKAA